MSIVNVARPDAFHRKPLRHQTELNPQGRLRESLILATLFEPGNWMRDYVNPGVVFTPTGLPVFSDSALGGGTLSSGVNGFLTMAPSPLLISPFSWTLSLSMLFTGAAPASDSYTIIDDVDVSYFFVQGAPNVSPGALTVANGVTVGSWSAVNYTGWHRLTVVSVNDATCTFYFDGVSQGTASFTGTPGQPMNILGGGGRTSINAAQFSDIFLWTAALTASQVAEHTADPYGTTLRPRYAEFGRVASAAAGAKRKPSLMTTGVGP